MNETSWNTWRVQPTDNGIWSSNTMTSKSLHTTLHPDHDTLYTFKDFDDFSQSDLLQPWMEFEPNIISFIVTDELIDTYSKMYGDTFPPHIILDQDHQSAPSRLLWQDVEHPTRFLQGIWTLWFLNGFVRRIFKFQDKTELLTPKMNNVVWPTPNPSWSKITSKFIVKDTKHIEQKIGNDTFDAIKITFTVTLFSDKIPIRLHEKTPRPVCIGDREMLYISANRKQP